MTKKGFIITTKGNVYVLELKMGPFFSKFTRCWIGHSKHSLKALSTKEFVPIGCYLGPLKKGKYPEKPYLRQIKKASTLVFVRGGRLAIRSRSKKEVRLSSEIQEVKENTI